MNNITFFDSLLKYFLQKNDNFSFSFTNLEERIIDFGDKTTLNFYKYIIEKIDLDYKYSSERKEKYDIKETYSRTFLTALGPLNLSLTRYKHKETGKSFYYVRDLLNIKPYQRLTLNTEYLLVKNAIENNMSFSARNTIRGYEISRSTVSNLIKKLPGSVHEKAPKEKKFIPVIYIEVDEIHANLQNKKKDKNEPSKNKSCPVMYVHEGYVDDNAKRKQKKNSHCFASADLNYHDLYNVVYEYIDSHYILNDKVTIFISGDGGNGIKTYDDAFPSAIYVADHFHYKKKMKVIFKTETNLLKMADSYIRNDKLEEFKKLVDLQIEKYPEQKDSIKKTSKYILANVQAIKNQNHELYKAHCSMEGTISSKYARYITSSPYAFSLKGLENKLKLLTLKANNHELTMDDYLMLRYSKDEYKEIVDSINKLTNIKNTVNLNDKTADSFVPSVKPFKLDDISTHDYVCNLIRCRRQIKI